jgi:hypothetical protein
MGAPAFQAKTQTAFSGRSAVIKPFWRQNRIYRPPTAP